MSRTHSLLVAANDEEYEHAVKRERRADQDYRLRSELRYAADTAVRLGIDRKAFLTAAAREYDWQLSAREPL